LPKSKPTDPFNAALQMLARRPYSLGEMRRGLERKFSAGPAVNQALARLRELGYLNDAKFAEQYAYSLAQNRAFGPARVRRELKAKLVNYKEIDPAIQQAYRDNPATQVLEQALAKKLRSLRLPLTRSRFHSLCQSLMRLGFNAGDVLKAVRSKPQLKPGADEVELLDLEASAEEPSS
jgi:regulatory protein